jgi:histone H2A
MIHGPQNRATNSTTTPLPSVQVIPDKHNRPVTVSRVLLNRPSTKVAAITGDIIDIHSIEEQQYESLTYDSATADMADTMDYNSSPSIDTPPPVTQKKTTPAIPKVKLPTKPTATTAPTAQKKSPTKPASSATVTKKAGDQHTADQQQQPQPAEDAASTSEAPKKSSVTTAKPKKKEDGAVADMNGHGGDSETSTKKRKPTSQSVRSGLVFPVGRVGRNMRRNSAVKRVGAGAPVYLSAVLEYIASEILDLAGMEAKQDKRKNIIPRHIKMAFANDIELEMLAKEMDMVIPNSGVIPNASIDMAVDRAKHRLIALGKQAKKESKKKNKKSDKKSE